MSTKKKIIGIDLGTTKSVVSYFPINATKPIVIKSQEGEELIPSVIAVSDENEIIVGKTAKSLYGLDPKNSVVQFVKRHMGEEDFKVKIKGKELSPSEVSSYVLKKMKQIASDYFHEDITEAVITVPAYFTIKQKEATKLAADLAGLNVVRMINEPTSAAISYGLGITESGEEQYDSQYFLVYDLGGGTFDVSIMELAPKSEGNLPVFNVISINGDRMLGGYDFDTRLTELIIEKIKIQYNIPLSKTDPSLKDVYDKIWIRVFKDAEIIKKKLSSAAETSVEFPSLPYLNGTELNVKVSVSRIEYENAIDDLLQRTMQLTEDAIKYSKKPISIDDIQTILLVGGSSRTPKVKEMIRNKFGLEPNLYDPDLCVSFGASIIGAVLSGISITRSDKNLIKRTKGPGMPAYDKITTADDQLTVHDCIAHSLGVQVQEHDFSVVLPRLSEYPCINMQRYATGIPNQPGVKVRVYQGEDPVAQKNVFMGEVFMQIEPRSYIVPIDVKFQLDSSGILTVTAIDAEKKIDAKIEIRGTTTMGISAKELQAQKEKLRQIEGIPLPNATKLLEKYQSLFQKIQEIKNKIPEAKRNILEKKEIQLRQAINVLNIGEVEETIKSIQEILMILDPTASNTSEQTFQEMEENYNEFLIKVEDIVTGLTGTKQQVLEQKLLALKEAIMNNDSQKARKMKESIDEFLSLL